MIIRRIPLNVLQKGVYDILTQKQTTIVYDYVPLGAGFPYIAFSDYSYEIEGSKTVDISVVTLEIEIWSDYDGKAVINDIAEDVIAVLTAWPIDLSASGFNLLSQDVKSGKGARSGDYFYGLVNFTARVQNVGV